MPSATAEHSIEVNVPRESAWEFWTDVSNWSLDSGVEAVQLDGPFAPGTTGVTHTGVQKFVWKITEVNPGERALLVMSEEGVEVDIEWTFSDLGDQTTLMTQRMTLPRFEGRRSRCHFSPNNARRYGQAKCSHSGLLEITAPLPYPLFADYTEYNC